MDATQILERQAVMEARRGNWESMWEDVARLVLPRSDDFRSKHSPGTQRNQQQYDAFPMAALDKYAAALEGGLIPRSTYWHKMSTGDDGLDDNHEVKLFLEEYNSTLWKARYSPRANFSGQANEKLLSLGAFGTGCLLVEARDTGGTKYRNIHLAEIFIDENNEGIIDTVHRKFEMTTRQAVQTFKENTPSKILTKFNAGKFGDIFEFIHCAMPREDYEHGRLDAKGMKYVGVYVCVDSKETIKEEGFHELPYIVSRPSTGSREIYGRSPAIQHLPDIAMLNEMRRTTIEAANMVVDPPTLMHEDVSEFDLTPGSRNYGTLDDNGTALAQAWNNQSRVDIGMEMMADTRNQIDDGFLGIYFRVLIENPQMTATQAMLVAQQQGQMTSPVVGRLQSEWLGPMIRRESAILFRQGKHPQMPQVLQEFLAGSDDGLQIIYESPLVRAARAEEAVAMSRTFEALAPIAQIDPTVFDVFDTKEVARVYADVNGVPAKVLKSKEAMADEADQQAQQAEMGQVLEAAPIAAQTAKTLAEAQALTQNAQQPVGV